MRRRRFRIRSLLLATGVLSSLLTTGSSNADPVVVCIDDTQGCWGIPFSEGATPDRPYGKYGGEYRPQTPEESMEFPTAVSIAMTPSGKLVYWNGLTDLEKSRAPLPLDAGRSGGVDQSRVLDLTGNGQPLWYTPANPTGGGTDGMFCADQRLLESGRVIVAGGTDYENDISLQDVAGEESPGGLAELYGSKETRLFDDAGVGAWAYDASRDMHYRRWYPTLVTQADGKLFAAGGVSKLLWNSTVVGDPEDDREATDVVPRNVPQTETYDPAADAWSVNNEATANKSLPLFARLHLLPSGEIFYAGAGQMWGPAGEDVAQTEWNFRATYNPADQKWKQLDDTGAFGARNGAFSVMLPLKYPYDKVQFLVGGGTLGTSPGSYLATNLTELVTVEDTDGDGVWESSSERVGDMVNSRWYSSGVLLPNGEVLALSGADKDEVVAPGTEKAVRQPELWNGSSWTGLSNGDPQTRRDRTYHNSAVLLPDGSVLVGGHAPINALYGAQGDGANDDRGFANNLKDPSFERFYPPYLSKGPRPVVLSTAEAAQYGGPLPFSADKDAAPIAKVVLSRLPSATHTTDADQRTVEVPFHEAGAQGMIVDVPDDPRILPPGYYYLFALSEQGVPAIAHIVRIGTAA